MRGLPDTCLVISHAHRMAINDRENRRLAPEGAVLLEHRAQGRAGTNQPQALAGAQARGGRWEGAQGVLRDGAGGERAHRAGRRAVLHARRAPAQHAPLPRHHLAQPALQREAPLRGGEPLHRRGAALGALRASRESPGLKPGISRDGAAKKKGSIPFPELPKNWAACRSPEGTENPAQAQRPGGVGKASELPHFLESSPVPCGPAREASSGVPANLTTAGG